MNPTIGRIVVYKTTEAERVKMGYNQLTNRSNNEQKELPAIIVAVWSETTINAQVILDGQDQLMWKTSITQGDGEGQWNWPVKN